MSFKVQYRGFTVVPGLLPLEIATQAIRTLGDVPGAGRRGMLFHPLVRELAGSEAFLSAVRTYLPCAPRPVRAIYFDKTPGANWLVAWHQDLSIAVAKKIETPRFGPWSIKDGLVHVQPPVELLESIITLRLHLDDTDETNGALRVLPGSHIHGRLSPQDIERLRASAPEVICRASRGDALLMRPLLLHASSRSTSDGHRRILHIEYAGCDLPNGLEWNHAA